MCESSSGLPIDDVPGERCPSKQIVIAFLAPAAPAAGTAGMHCAITRYVQWVRAQATPPDADAKARKLQETKLSPQCGR